VAAHVIDRIELAGDIEYPDRLAVDFDALAAPRLYVARFTNFNKIRHAASFPFRRESSA
jgi:hypothetical protein